MRTRPFRQGFEPLVWSLFAMCLLLAQPALPQAANAIKPPPAPVLDFIKDRVCTDKLPLFFVPIEPTPPSGKLLVTARLATSETTPLGSAETFDKLIEQGTSIAVLSTTTDWKITYLVASVSKKDQRYKVFHDTSWYRTVIENDATTNKPTYFYHIGVAIRVVADFVARKADINLAGIAAIGVSGSKESLDGTLDAKAVGLQGRDIPMVLPAVTQLSPEALTAALQAVGGMKARIWDGAHVPSVPGALQEKVNGLKDLSEAEKKLLTGALSYSEGRDATRIEIEPLILAMGVCPTASSVEKENGVVTGFTLY